MRIALSTFKTETRSVSYIQFLLRITFYSARCEHVSNHIVKWDIAKNTSPLFESKVLQDGGEPQHSTQKTAFQHTACTQVFILYSPKVKDCSLFL